VSVSAKASFVASTSIGWLNHISTVAGSTSVASVSGWVLVTCAPGWTTNEKFALPPIGLPTRSCEPIRLIVYRDPGSRRPGRREDEVAVLPAEVALDGRGDDEVVLHIGFVHGRAEADGDLTRRADVLRRAIRRLRPASLGRRIGGLHRQRLGGRLGGGGVGRRSGQTGLEVGHRGRGLGGEGIAARSVGAAGPRIDGSAGHHDEVALVGAPQALGADGELGAVLVPRGAELLCREHLERGLDRVGVHGGVEWDGDGIVAGDRHAHALWEQRFGDQRFRLWARLDGGSRLLGESDDEGEREGCQRDAGDGSVAAQQRAKRLEQGGQVRYGSDRTQ
jgi:hypothetical protein